MEPDRQWTIEPILLYRRLIDVDDDDGECVCVEDFMTDNSGKNCWFFSQLSGQSLRFNQIKLQEKNELLFKNSVPGFIKNWQRPFDIYMCAFECV